MLGHLKASAFHPSELSALVQLKFSKLVRKAPSKPLRELAGELSDVDYCYAVLHKVSRSFAVVIQQLDEELKDTVCIFYLVLRGLDSIEDDMTFPLADKLPLLLSFHEKLEVPDYSLHGVGDKDDYRAMLEDFPKVLRVYSALKPEYRAVIKDITARMGAGMARYQQQAEGCVATVAEYNEYCHYVAGLVGIGLSKLFAASGLESAELTSTVPFSYPDLNPADALSNSMGLFLQKVNIIRDYLEDHAEARTWWPREIWGQYADSLSWFAKNPDAPQSRACLNHMVTDALALVPEVLCYLAKLRNTSVFAFCAIPQVMAMATLADVYNNIRVFSSVVKVRKGLTAVFILNSTDMAKVRGFFATLARRVLAEAERVPVAGAGAGVDAKKAAAVKADTVRYAARALELAAHSGQPCVEAGGVGAVVTPLLIAGAIAVAAAAYITRAGAGSGGAQ